MQRTRILLLIPWVILPSISKSPGTKSKNFRLRRAKVDITMIILYTRRKLWGAALVIPYFPLPKTQFNVTIFLQTIRRQNEVKRWWYLPLQGSRFAIFDSIFLNTFLNPYRFHARLRTQYVPPNYFGTTLGPSPSLRAARCIDQILGWLQKQRESRSNAA